LEFLGNISGGSILNHVECLTILFKIQPSKIRIQSRIFSRVPGPKAAIVSMIDT